MDQVDFCVPRFYCKKDTLTQLVQLLPCHLPYFSFSFRSNEQSILLQISSNNNHNEGQRCVQYPGCCAAAFFGALSNEGARTRNPHTTPSIYGFIMLAGRWNYLWHLFSSHTRISLGTWRDADPAGTSHDSLGWREIRRIRRHSLKFNWSHALPHVG